MIYKIKTSLLICLLCSAILFAQEHDDLFPTDSVVTGYHNDWTIKSYQRRIADFKKDVPEKNDIFFIGNSITQQGRDWTEKFNLKHLKNRGIAGDVTDGVLCRLDEIIFYKPKAVFILIGINDLFNLHQDMDKKKRFKYEKTIPSAEYVGENIIKIAKTLHKKLPDTKIYVRTLLPTRRSFLKNDVQKINTLIKKNEDKGYYSVVDLYSVFVDDLGNLKKELTKDGVHLNDDGYKVWVDYEKPILNQFYK